MNKADIEQLDTTEKLLKLFPKILKISEQNFASILYVSGLILALEEVLTFIIAGAIKSGITKKLRDPNTIEFIIHELTFNSKIKILKQANSQDVKRASRYKKFLAYLDEVNGIRNKIFHGKLGNLQYKHNPIVEVATQHRMLLDYLDASKEATERNR